MAHLLETPQQPDRARSILLSSVADPEAAARYLDSFEKLHPVSFERLAKSSPGLHTLLVVFSNSRFLSEEVLQHPEWIDSLAVSNDLYRVLSAEEFARNLEESLPSGSDAPTALSLAVFRRRQLLRILIRDVMGHATLSETAEELSNLADAILDVTYRRIRTSLIHRYGTPRYIGRSGNWEECGFSVIALGKLGGRELNYSSDIDLMFFYSANGETDGEHSVSNKEFYKKVANIYTGLLSTYTAEGMCYRVDLRLRPDGKLGEVCLSLEGGNRYYESRARDWELQMLIKARVAAGEPGPGRELLEHAEPRIYASTLDFSAVEAVSVTRERIHEKLVAKKAVHDSGLDVKLARGGIRDIEFLVQCLQRLHGGREQWVRSGGTLLALLRLRDKHYLSEKEYGRLASAYEFLRYLEHRLQVLDDRQTHTLPSRAEELSILSRRMPASEVGRAPSGEKLLHQLNIHLEEVQETYDRVIHSQQPLYYNSPLTYTSSSVSTRKTAPAEVFQDARSSNLIRFLDQRAPGLAACLSQYPLQRGHHSFEHFLEKIYANDVHLRLLNGNCDIARDTVELFENSPHFAEELIRHPELVEELSRIRSGVYPPYDRHMSDLLTEPSQLRRFFRREMLRIQAESICLGSPIFETLGRTSDLADGTICAAYNLARAHVERSHPPETPHYQPVDQMIVVALGRLGMREFDLGSDADLIFVLPDEDVKESRFWTRVAERMIDVITAYTGDGIMFAVDTRLRPNGREGSLVQSVGSYKDYLATAAEAWEGITYMKSRAVAGNGPNATAFLHELQEVDWRRYGQSGRSRTDLRDMRFRVEREQGAGNPLKAGCGGYYDIDFAVMYLRLKSAGIFFKVLNSPERIDVIEKMGHLERADADFLRDAAKFYRSIDHGLRVYSGHAEGKLPNSEAHLETLTRLVHRWTPEQLHDKPLPEKLEEIQQRTREYFIRLFG